MVGERLAGLIEARRPIYDFSLKEHSNKAVVERLWAEIAAGMQATVVDCKAKWTSMRNSYARYLRDVKSAAIGGVKKRKWYLADSMAFLNDFMYQNKKTPNNWDIAADDTTDKSLGEHEKEANHHFGLEMFENSTVPRSYTTNISKSNSVDGHNCESSSDIFQSEADVLFFRSLVADMNKLSERRKRRFKEMTMSSLYSLVDSQEDESPRKEYLHVGNTNSKPSRATTASSPWAF